MRSYPLTGEVQADLESSALLAGIAACLDRIEADGLAETFAGARQLLIAAHRQPDGAFTVSLLRTPLRGFPGYRRFCRQDPDRVARVFARDPVELARLAAVVHPLSPEMQRQWQERSASPQP